MAKLNQIIAVEKGLKSQVYSELTDVNKIVQKPELFNGFTKKYERKDEDSETLPPENKRIHITVQDVLRNTQHIMSQIFDITARKDYTNCAAKASVVVEGAVLVKDAPVSFLLFLEKNLTDIRTLFVNLPVLDPADVWEMDAALGIYRAAEVQTHRTKKVQKPIVLYQATEQHPAQTQLITEDIIAGYWKQTKLSGAIKYTHKLRIVERLTKVLQAVKQAREEANGIDEVAVQPVGDPIFEYILKMED